MWVCINEKRDGGRQKGRLPSPSARSRGKSFVAMLRAHSIILVNGDSSCFHLDCSHFLKFRKQQRERDCVRARLSPNHLPAFPLTAFEAAFRAESCLHQEQEQSHPFKPRRANAAACTITGNMLGFCFAESNYKQKSFLMIR